MQTKEDFNQEIENAKAALVELQKMAEGPSLEDYHNLHRLAIDGNDKTMFDRYYIASKQAEEWCASCVLPIYNKAKFAIDAVDFSSQVGGIASPEQSRIAEKIAGEAVELFEKIKRLKVVEIFNA